MLEAAAWAVAGYLIGAMVAMVGASMVYGRSTNFVSNQGTRDRWVFIVALMGLMLGAVLSWRRSDRS